MRVRPRNSARSWKRHYTVAALIPALIVVLSITGFMWAQKEVTVVVDGRAVPVNTQAGTVAEALADAGVNVDSDDMVTPSAGSSVHNGDTVVVRHTVPVTLDLGDGRFELDVVGETVADALVAAGADPTSNPAVTPALDTPLTDHLTITVPEVFTRVVQDETTVTPAVRIEKDDTLPKGVKRVVSRGNSGRMLKVYRTLVTNGVEGPKVLTAEKVVEHAEPRVVAVGTAPAHLVAVANRKVAVPPAPRGGRRMRVEATGYSPRQPGLDFTTATGARATHGVIAVDPRVIPLGTRVYVPGYGYAVARDTGGAIKGNRIDLCYETVAEAIRWGRRTVTIIVLD